MTYLSPRSGRWHKAWGVSPRINRKKNWSPRSGRQPIEFNVWRNRRSVARSAGSLFFKLSASWGSASLHPRLYAAVRCAHYELLASDEDLLEIQFHGELDLPGWKGAGDRTEGAAGNV
jgi:hypothetical protein